MSSRTDTYKSLYKEEDMPGLDAINIKERQLYANQEPAHYATILPYELGGKDPLWAVDGFTNLFYDEEFAEDEVNGFGFEITFRYLPSRDEIDVPIWPINFFRNIARYVFEYQKPFDDFHYMSANGPIRAGVKTDITAFAFYPDPELGEMETPHGYFKFLQLYGITTQEYNDIRAKKYSCRDLITKHLVNNPLLITNLNRK